jgi:hypothetical protein
MGGLFWVIVIPIKNDTKGAMATAKAITTGLKLKTLYYRQF